MSPNGWEIGPEDGCLGAAPDGERYGVRDGEGLQWAMQRPPRRAAWVKTGKGGMRLEDSDGHVLYPPTWTPSQMVDWAYEHGYQLRLPEVERG